MLFAYFCNEIKKSHERNLMFNKIPGKPYDIVCKEQGLPEFPGLLFGVSNDNGLMYFNASAYLRSKGNDLKLPDFLNSYQPLIAALQETYSIKDDEVCRINNDGDFVIEVDFVYLFICYTDHRFTGYINERMNDLFAAGIAISDSYLFESAKSRLSADVIAKMIQDEGNKSEIS